MSRYGTYLYRRRGSPNWWLRLQYPEALSRTFGFKRKVERSLGTSNRLEAELLAAQDINDHKALLFLRKHGRTLEVGPNRPKYELGEAHRLPNGLISIAGKDRLISVDEHGETVEVQNPTVQDVFFRNVSKRDAATIIGGRQEVGQGRDELLEQWVSRRNVNRHVAAEARKVYELLKIVSKVSDIAEIKRNHVDDLVIELEKQGNKSTTINKKIGHLRAVVNQAIDDGVMEGNVFARYEIKRNDKLRRRPLSEDDMAIVRDSFSILSNEDVLLWKLLACTGMRLSEAFESTEVHLENKIKYVVVGKKSETSERRIPLPKSVENLFEAGRIGPLLPGRSDPAGKRFAYLLKKLEISYDRKTGKGSRSKVLHSLRHRAKDRLRALGCPLDIQYELLGHEKKTIASSYGHGYPVSMLKEWIDKVTY